MELVPDRQLTAGSTLTHHYESKGNEECCESCDAGPLDLRETARWVHFLLHNSIYYIPNVKYHVANEIGHYWSPSTLSKQAYIYISLLLTSSPLPLS